jgi:two-component system response regulator TctD
MKVLLIEDNLQLAITLTQSFGMLGIVVDTQSDGALADAALHKHAYDVVILDLALPTMDGFEILRRLRGRNDSVPVLMLTASGDIYDRVHGLNAGADDYLPKPFDLTELEARLRALHRRSLGSVHAVLRVGMLEFDTVSRRFCLRAHQLDDLPPREHDLLEILIAHAGRPVSKNMLADRLCTSDAVLSHDALEIYVHRLRRRLDGSGAAIRTLRGLGYVLEASPDAPS